MKFNKKRSAKRLSQEQEEERDFDKERRERQIWRHPFPDPASEWP